VTRDKPSPIPGVLDGPVDQVADVFQAAIQCRRCSTARGDEPLLDDAERHDCGCEGVSKLVCESADVLEFFVCGRGGPAPIVLGDGGGDAITG
jgi:hypothetical protein